MQFVTVRVCQWPPSLVLFWQTLWPCPLVLSFSSFSSSHCVSCCSSIMTHLSFRTFILTVPSASSRCQMAWSPISFRSLLKCHLITKRPFLTTLCKIWLLFPAGSSHFLSPYPVLLFTLITWQIIYFFKIYLLIFPFY